MTSKSDLKQRIALSALSFTNNFGPLTLARQGQIEAREMVADKLVEALSYNGLCISEEGREYQGRIMLTKRMLELYRAIEAHKEKHGIAPTYKEMQVALGAKSTGHISRLMGSLEERGAIRRLKNRARAIELLPLK